MHYAWLVGVLGVCGCATPLPVLVAMDPPVVQESVPAPPVEVAPIWLPPTGGSNPVPAIESANAGAVITPGSFSGGIAYVPYVPGAIYRVDSAIHRPTRLVFSAEEEVLVVSRTEETEWTVEPVREVKPHRLLIAPVDPKARTRMLIETTLGSYTLDLRANARTSLVEVQWVHPAKPSRVEPVSTVYGVGYAVSDLQVSWKPTYAWDDGRATYLLMGQDYHGGEAPVAAIIDAAGVRTLVNYRQYDQVIHLDRFLTSAERLELRLGHGDVSQVVLVSKHGGYARIRCPGQGACATIAAHAPQERYAQP